MINKVTLFFRKRLPQFNSIEGLFYNISDILKRNMHVDLIELPSSSFNIRGIWKNLKFAQNKRGEINHITGHVNYLALTTGRRTILTIHDVKSSFYGNFVHRLLIKLILYWIPAVLVKKITVISKFSKRELEAIIPFAKQKVTVIYNPVNDIFQPREFTFNRQCPKILCIGTKANKNLERIFEAISGITCQLRILGSLSEQQLCLLKKYDINYANEVNLTLEEVVNEYEKCDLLCFPSTYEGFGMPIIEAQAVGRPVVTSNIGAMQEVAKDSACLVDPFNPEEIRDGIKRVLTNEVYRNELVAKGFDNIKRFQIEVIAKEYVKVYEEVLNS